MTNVLHEHLRHLVAMYLCSTISDVRIQKLETAAWVFATPGCEGTVLKADYSQVEVPNFHR